VIPEYKRSRISSVWCFGQLSTINSPSARSDRIMVGDESDILQRLSCLRRTGGLWYLIFARVDAIDAGGIGLLVFLQAWARAGGIELKLVNPTQLVRELLELTNLNSVFGISSSKDLVLSHPLADPTTGDAAAYQSTDY
jgi:anti-anti-sigma regulatory factor